LIIIMLMISFTSAFSQKHVRIYGTPSNPMTIKGKLLLPGQVQGYNGYEIALSLSTPDPAYMEK